MLIKDVFAQSVTRNIPPVIYFHEQDPKALASEVGEYIITGGYPEDDPRYQYTKNQGIHEQFVRLLRALASELQRPDGPELPASWISGFYGSGKSSFAKLLGLALDGVVLPDGQPLGEALLRRDESPQSKVLRQEWEALQQEIDPLAVIFDVGSSARDNEQIHSVVRRELQIRLGYCKNDHVANHELKLEQNGEWERFLEMAAEVLNQPWNEARGSSVADEDFSLVLHHLYPDRYTDPLSWYDSRAGSRMESSLSVSETTQAIAEMLKYRAPGKTLFVVVDEVSQYIYQDSDKSQKLHSFVSDLGQKLKGKVWLLVTGQQKIEDSDDQSNIGILKDRFPPKLRVHLAPANIRDVVHKRLLKKHSQHEASLKALFHQHRSALKLYGYQCQSLTEQDFLEVYPLLPGYIDLLMSISSNLRLRSARARSDDHAIRGLLQLLGELFREKQLGDRPLGSLVTLADVYDIQQSALDNDAQNTMNRIIRHEQVQENEQAIQVAKAVALLQVIQEQEPTTAQLVSQCLYAQLGQENPEKDITQTLERLRELNLLSFAEKTGYKLLSTLGQEWARERDTHHASTPEMSKLVQDNLKQLVGDAGLPKYKGTNFNWLVLYSDSTHVQPERLISKIDPTVITVNFFYSRSPQLWASRDWLGESANPMNRNSLLWISGRGGDLENLLGELVKSRRMVDRYKPGLESLTPDKRRLTSDEEARMESLNAQVKTAVAQAFFQGQVYFRGRNLDLMGLGSSFNTVLIQVANQTLPEIYDRYLNISVKTLELQQLLQTDASGISQKFMTGDDRLGLMELQSGKPVFTCTGQIPQRIQEELLNANGLSGAVLLKQFGGPPYGYSAEVIKACVAGLLRANKIRLRPEAGQEISSIRDPGTQDIFGRDRDFKQAEILPPKDVGITSRDRVAICKFFQSAFQIEVERENDAIAEKVFDYLPAQSKRLRELEHRYNQLPNRPELPETLSRFQTAVEACTRSRHVEEVVKALKKHLDVLQDGIQQLGIALSDLTEETIAAVRRAATLQANQIKQLREAEAEGEVSSDITQVENHLQGDRPWRDIQSLDPALAKIEAHYEGIRSALLQKQRQVAEAVRQRVEQRRDYDKLTKAQQDIVLSPLHEAQNKYDVGSDTLYPSLIQLRNTQHFSKAEQEAQHRLSVELAKLTGTQVVEVELNLQNREVSSPEEVEALLNQIRDQLLTKLGNSNQVRVRIR